jgi:hypothetical protein
MKSTKSATREIIFIQIPMDDFEKKDIYERSMEKSIKYKELLLSGIENKKRLTNEARKSKNFDFIKFRNRYDKKQEIIQKSTINSKKEDRKVLRLTQIKETLKKRRQEEVDSEVSSVYKIKGNSPMISLSDTPSSVSSFVFFRDNKNSIRKSPVSNRIVVESPILETACNDVKNLQLIIQEPLVYKSPVKSVKYPKTPKSLTNLKNTHGSKHSDENINESEGESNNGSIIINTILKSPEKNKYKSPIKSPVKSLSKEIISPLSSQTTPTIIPKINPKSSETIILNENIESHKNIPVKSYIKSREKCTENKNDDYYEIENKNKCHGNSSCEYRRNISPIKTLKSSVHNNNFSQFLPIGSRTISTISSIKSSLSEISGINSSISKKSNSDLKRLRNFSGHKFNSSFSISTINISRKNKEEDDEEIGEKISEFDEKIQLLYKFQLLKHRYPHIMVDYPFSRKTDIKILRNTYEMIFKDMKLKNKVNTYTAYLHTGFSIFEYILGNIGFDMEGFSKNQIDSIKNYEDLLEELGEKEYTSKIIPSNYCVEIRLLFTIALNAVLFIVGRIIIKKTNLDLIGIMKSDELAKSNRSETSKSKRRNSINDDQGNGEKKVRGFTIRSTMD